MYLKRGTVCAAWFLFAFLLVELFGDENAAAAAADHDTNEGLYV